MLSLALFVRSIVRQQGDRACQQRQRQYGAHGGEEIERQREHGEFSLLSIPMAWLPPILAAVVCGLQLTFWENATAASSEMLSLLLFAYVIRNVLEYRIDERESW